MVSALEFFLYNRCLQALHYAQSRSIGVFEFHSYCRIQALRYHQPGNIFNKLHVLHFSRGVPLRLRKRPEISLIAGFVKNDPLYLHLFTEPDPASDLEIQLAESILEWQGHQSTG